MFPMLYHTHHTLVAEDIPFWLRMAAQYPDPILELGSGTGRVFVPLWEAGHKIFGLDNDLGMLLYLKKNTWKHAPDQPSVFQADCAEFHCSLKFGLVLMPCNTFSTLSSEKRRATLKLVSQHLQAAGALVLSLPNPALLDRLPSNAEPEIEEYFNHPMDGEPVQVSSAWRKTHNQFILTWHYDHLLPDGRIERTSTQIAHELVSTQTILQEIRDSGLATIQLFGDYDQTPYAAESPDLITYCPKGINPFILYSLQPAQVG